MESNKLEYKLYNKSVVVCTNEWKQPKCHCDMLLLFPWTNIRHGEMQPILGRTWLEWIRLSRIFRAPFANLSLEIVKKMSRYYLLSGLSRIFRKPFANVYISRKVPFAQTFQIYACGPRLYKTFHGFLHDSHMYNIVYASFHYGKDPPAINPAKGPRNRCSELQIMWLQDESCKTKSICVNVCLLCEWTFFYSLLCVFLLAGGLRAHPTCQLEDSKVSWVESKSPAKGFSLETVHYSRTMTKHDGLPVWMP